MNTEKKYHVIYWTSGGTLRCSMGFLAEVPAKTWFDLMCESENATDVEMIEQTDSERRKIETFCLDDLATESFSKRKTE